MFEVYGDGQTLILSLEIAGFALLLLAGIGIAAATVWLYLAPPFTDLDIRLTGWVVLGLTAVTNVICLPQLAFAIMFTLLPLVPVFAGMKLVLRWSCISARRESHSGTSEIE